MREFLRQITETAGDILSRRVIFISNSYGVEEVTVNQGELVGMGLMTAGIFRGRRRLALAGLVIFYAGMVSDGLSIKNRSGGFVSEAKKRAAEAEFAERRRVYKKRWTD